MKPLSPTSLLNSIQNLKHQLNHDKHLLKQAQHDIENNPPNMPLPQKDSPEPSIMPVALSTTHKLRLKEAHQKHRKQVEELKINHTKEVESLFAQKQAEVDSVRKALTRIIEEQQTTIKQLQQQILTDQDTQKTQILDAATQTQPQKVVKNVNFETVVNNLMEQNQRLRSQVRRMSQERHHQFGTLSLSVVPESDSSSQQQMSVVETTEFQLVCSNGQGSPYDAIRVSAAATSETGWTDKTLGEEGTLMTIKEWFIEGDGQARWRPVSYKTSPHQSQAR